MLDIPTNRSFYTYYLNGDGIEIGALHGAVKMLNPATRVKYVDYRSTEDLRIKYPTLENIVEVDYVSSADDLSCIEAGSQDFIIANHVIEHVVDPLKTLAIWHSKLKQDGILFMAYPVPQYCGDRCRPMTKLAHLVEETVAGIREPCDEHILAFVWGWNPGPHFKVPEEIERALQYLWDRGLNYLDDEAWGMIRESRPDVERLINLRIPDVHHHLFDNDLFVQMLDWLSDNRGARYVVEDLSLAKGLLSENILILRKRECGPILSERARVALHCEKFVDDVVRAVLGR